MDESPLLDSDLLPSSFDERELWAVALQTKEGAASEGLVLADAGTHGLKALQHAYPPTSQHALALAFPLTALVALCRGLEEHEADSGALSASALESDRHWPSWLPHGPGSVLALSYDPLSGTPEASWIRTEARGEAVVAIHRTRPGHALLAFGELEVLKSRTQSLEQVVAEQNFGAVWLDLRTQVSKPATRAHISAYPLAALGHYSTPQIAMAEHQAMFLEDDINQDSTP